MGHKQIISVSARANLNQFNCWKKLHQNVQSCSWTGVTRNSHVMMLGWGWRVRGWGAIQSSSALTQQREVRGRSFTRQTNYRGQVRGGWRERSISHLPAQLDRTAWSSSQLSIISYVHSIPKPLLLFTRCSKLTPWLIFFKVASLVRVIVTFTLACETWQWFCWLFVPTTAALQYFSNCNAMLVGKKLFWDLKKHKSF